MIRRCIYCGVFTRGRALACAAHDDLLALDPWHRLEVVASSAVRGLPEPGRVSSPSRP